ncbi:beta-lactamase domain-containing protein 2-like isoform X2 [Mya arenaria]|uniref:beta-lactamase domain-containing protein 2-like isoform X2 n=1 Tax=Mya arenaria TaxID=6604 RepID=UPI0022E7D088|nr:beta-lactamase domain-containing protein 2-like isoform X2 [Mya arenaria]
MENIKLACIIAILAVSCYFVPKSFEHKLLPIVEGDFQPEFRDVAMAFRANMEAGREKGAAFVVYHKGEPVFDMWAGYADRQSLRRWRNNTTTMMFGAGRAVTTFLVAQMVDRGLLNYSKPVTDYWPEFGSHGKQNITLEMLLSHQTGTHYFEEPISLRDLNTQQARIDKVICDLKPLWKTGSHIVSHDLVSGLILDRLIERVDPKHRDIYTMVQEEITKPLDVKLSMHLSRVDVYKTARIHSPSVTNFLYQAVTSPKYLWLHINSWFRKGSYIGKMYSSPSTVFNDPELREITLSSVSVTGTARGMAKLFSILSNQGQYKGDQVLKQETLTQLLTRTVTGVCPETGFHVSYTRGLQSFTNPYGETVYGQSGYGGQVVIADPSNQLSMAYASSYLSIYEFGEDPRFTDLQSKLYTNLQRYIERQLKG